MNIFTFLRRGCAIATVSLLVHDAGAQDALRNRYGVYGHGVIGQHSADFLRIPGTLSCCDGYTGGSGFGIGAGALVELPVASGMLLSLRAAFLNQPFDMTTREATFLIVNGQGQDGAFEHRLNGSFSTIGIEPLIGLNITGGLFAHAGVRLGLPMASSYEQLEQLTEPDGVGTFLNPDGTDSHKRTRNEFSGEIPNVGFQIAPMIGLSMELPLNARKTMLLVPEVFYQLAVSNVTSDLSWKANAIRFGVALKYSPVAPPASAPPARDTVPVPPSVAVTPPPVASAPAMAATVSAVGIEADGREKNIAAMRVEEFSSTLMTPLLGYVFFDAGSSEIPTRYRRITPAEAAAFVPERMNSSAKLPAYQQLLNTVGKRMQQHPDARLTMSGHTDGTGEKGNTDLARSRAEAVKDYLQRTFGIAANRLVVQAKGLPATASGITTEDGNQENRRVELASGTPEVLAPLVTNDTLRSSNPPGLRFKPTVRSEAGIASWKLVATQNGRTLRTFEGTGAVPEFIDWKLADEQASIPKFDGKVEYTLVATDVRGTTATGSGVLPLELVTVHRKRMERKGDKEIDRYSLFLFDVRSAELTAGNRGTTEFIRSRLKPTSSLVVTGYTDQRGDAALNDKLARDRATNTATALGMMKSTRIEAKGNTNLYDNNLPEGRFYSRTVDIVVETPVVE